MTVSGIRPQSHRMGTTSSTLHACWFFTVFFLCAFAFPIQAGETTRSVGGTSTSPTVTIHADPQGTASAWAVEEGVPSAVSPSDISENGTYDAVNGKVKWGLFLDAAPRNLSYTVTAPDGNHAVVGTGSFDGSDSGVAGESVISVGCQFPSIEFFRAEPNQIDLGGSATLSWSISNASSARIDNGVGDIDPGQGTATVSPRETTTYTLTAGNACGPDIKVTTIRVGATAADKAVIVIGKQAQNDSLLASFRNCGDFAYTALARRGFTSGTIYYLDPPSSEGETPREYRDGDSTTAQVKYALTEWAKGARDVILYLVDHGTEGKVFLSPTEALYTYQLKPWLDELDETISGTIVVIVEACHSGSFIEGLAPKTGKPRIVIASTQPEDEAILLREGHNSFSQKFWQEVQNDYDLFAAFVNTAEDLRWSNLGRDADGKTRQQIPLFDADGDGIASTGFDQQDSDRTVASSHVIGESQGSAASVPTIAEVCPDADVGGESGAVLWAKIEYSGTGIIDQAWAVIIPPGFEHDSASQPVTDSDLDLVYLEYKGNRWEADYHGFNRTGEYQVTFFAADDEGTVSSPKTALFTKSVPDKFADGIYKSAGNDMNAYVQTYDTGSAVVILTPDLQEWFVFVEGSWADGITDLQDYAGMGHRLTMNLQEDGRISASLSYADGRTASWTLEKNFGIPDPVGGYDGIFKAEDGSMNAYVQTYDAGSALVILTPDLKTWTAFLDPDYSDGINAANDLAGLGRQFFMNFVSTSRANGGLTFPSGAFNAFSMNKAFASPAGATTAVSTLSDADEFDIGPFADPANAHPADLNADFRLEWSEVQAYQSAWKQGQTWSKAPNPIPIGYLTRAGFLYELGETYQYIGGSAPACWVAGETFTNSLGMKFKYITPGSFAMGSPTSETYRQGDERQHQVTLTRGFYIQTTEVTQGQWKAVMGGSNPSYFTACGDNCPVEMVSWDEIQTFVAKMNQRGEGTYRLPTEAEWEYAARAGTTTAFFNGANTEPECGYDPNAAAIGWYCYNSGDTTHPVAQKTPNPWGLYDMSGNVWEACQDHYGEYPAAPVTDPTGPAAGEYRVFRGGCWFHSASCGRSARRWNITQETRYT